MKEKIFCGGNFCVKSQRKRCKVCNIYVCGMCSIPSEGKYMCPECGFKNELKYGLEVWHSFFKTGDKNDKEKS